MGAREGEGPEGGLPIPFPSHHFFPNPTNQCPDPTDMLTRHQSHSHFGFFSHSNPSPSDQNPIFPVQKQANPNSHFTPSGPSREERAPAQEAQENRFPPPIQLPGSRRVICQKFSQKMIDLAQTERAKAL